MSSADLSPITQTYVPVMTRTRFSELSGLEEGVIRGMCEKGHLPTIKFGRHSLINIHELVRECSERGADL